MGVSEYLSLLPKQSVESTAAIKIARALLKDLLADDSMEKVFEWPMVYEEVVRDLSQVGLQAERRQRENTHNTDAFLFDSFVYGMMLRRAERLRRFLKKLAGAISEFFRRMEKNPKAVTLRFLEADSHNQGERPVTFFLDGYRYVLKFRDPRPYLVLQHILQRLEAALKIELSPPTIWYDASNDWHVMPYLATAQKASQAAEPAAFMIRLGAITAVAYFLKMTDVHLENMLISNGIPVIIDTECIFYDYNEYSAITIEERLWSTGLVGIDPAFSAIRGGTDPIYDFGAKEEDDKITYIRLAIDRNRHRLIDDQGNVVDPVHYTAALWDGFSKAYQVLCQRKEALAYEIEAIASPGMRTRFLLRFTLHYATVIEMLRKPTAEDTLTRLGRITSVFLKSGGLSNLIDEQVQRRELLDMLDSDIPLFWVEDRQNEPMLMHWSGPVRGLSAKDALTKRIQRVTASCAISDLPRLKASLNEFLHSNRPPAS